MDLPDPGSLSVVTIPVTAVSASRGLYNRGCWLLGWSLIEPGGVAPAQALFYDGTGVDGSLVAGLSIPASGGSTQALGPSGFPCAGGLFFDVVAGELTGGVVIGT